MRGSRKFARMKSADAESSEKDLRGEFIVRQVKRSEPRAGLLAVKDIPRRWMLSPSHNSFTSFLLFSCPISVSALDISYNINDEFIFQNALASFLALPKSLLALAFNSVLQ